ncbi:hypothetical protein CKO25_12415 [Thiocapsa imhoffii]|uniref:DUF6487 domain-containing protein n=2 Tax=Thiocapsa imhoffii TaxID=382777 RepID=A0A9X0WJ00_9GAMM|nr:hypothetical protein [Thiocapsa imhoffii]
MRLAGVSFVAFQVVGITTMNPFVELWGAVLAAIAALGLLWFIVRTIQRSSREIADTPTLWVGRDYACPACARPLRQGWVLMGKGAIWAERDQRPLSPFVHIGNAMPNTISMSWRPATNLAWRCEHCELLLIDHSRLVARRRAARATGPG